eukprot:CFRG0706T1
MSKPPRRRLGTSQRGKDLRSLILAKKTSDELEQDTTDRVKDRESQRDDCMRVVTALCTHPCAYSFHSVLDISQYPNLETIKAKAISGGYDEGLCLLRDDLFQLFALYTRTYDATSSKGRMAAELERYFTRYLEKRFGIGPPTVESDISVGEEKQRDDMESEYRTLCRPVANIVPSSRITTRIKTTSKSKSSSSPRSTSNQSNEEKSKRKKRCATQTSNLIPEDHSQRDVSSNAQGSNTAPVSASQTSPLVCKPLVRARVLTVSTEIRSGSTSDSTEPSQITAIANPNMPIVDNTTETHDIVLDRHDRTTATSFTTVLTQSSPVNMTTCATTTKAQTKDILVNINPDRSAHTVTRAKNITSITTAPTTTAISIIGDKDVTDTVHVTVVASTPPADIAKRPTYTGVRRSSSFTVTSDPTLVPGDDTHGMIIPETPPSTLIRSGAEKRPDAMASVASEVLTRRKLLLEDEQDLNATAKSQGTLPQLAISHETVDATVSECWKGHRRSLSKTIRNRRASVHTSIDRQKELALVDKQKTCKSLLSLPHRIHRNKSHAGVLSTTTDEGDANHTPHSQISTHSSINKHVSACIRKCVAPHDDVAKILCTSMSTKALLSTTPTSIQAPTPTRDSALKTQVVSKDTTVCTRSPATNVATLPTTRSASKVKINSVDCCADPQTTRNTAPAYADALAPIPVLTNISTAVISKIVSPYGDTTRCGNAASASPRMRLDASTLQAKSYTTEKNPKRVIDSDNIRLRARLSLPCPNLERFRYKDRVANDQEHKPTEILMRYDRKSSSPSPASIHIRTCEPTRTTVVTPTPISIPTPTLTTREFASMSNPMLKLEPTVTPVLARALTPTLVSMHNAKKVTPKYEICLPGKCLDSSTDRTPQPAVPNATPSKQSRNKTLTALSRQTHTHVESLECSEPVISPPYDDSSPPLVPSTTAQKKLRQKLREEQLRLWKLREIKEGRDLRARKRDSPLPTNETCPVKTDISRRISWNKEVFYCIFESDQSIVDKKPTRRNCDIAE